MGAPSRESLPTQEFRLSLEELRYQLNHHKTEIDLFQERILHLEQVLEQLRSNKAMKSAEAKLASLEKAQEALATDLKTLKSHLLETNSSLASCQSKIASLDEQISTDIRSLKQSLQNMLALLQKEDAPKDKSYIVKPGDSLGQIALDHKTDIKTLKKLNNLANDTIFVGQKIFVP